MNIKDSGTRTNFDTGAVRDGQAGKGRFDLMPFEALWELSKIFEAGANKYADRNWEKGIPLHVFVSSALRHLTKWTLGWKDEPHLAMFVWNAVCLLQTKLWIESGQLPASLNSFPTAAVDAPCQGPEPAVEAVRTEQQDAKIRLFDPTAVDLFFDYGPF